MHPAYSVIFFTVASGIGYGMLVVLALGAWLGWLAADRGFGLAAFGVAFALVTFGLLSSTFHLGHPERAWRALSQWRTSWLSREGVTSLVTFVPTGLFALGWVVFGENSGGWIWLGVAGAACAAITVACTGMIYQSLAAIPRWNNGLVTPLYLLFALASGAVFVAWIAALFGLGAGWIAWVAAGASALAWALKLAYWRSIDRAPSRHTAASATGLGAPGSVRLLEAHTSETYIQREMGYRVARKHARRLRVIAVALGGALPALLAAVDGWAAVPALTLAAAGSAAGLMVERWLFFAEARHAVMLYHGAASA